jgi:glycosyltransferase involved in cell wall biosynthesis
MRILFVTMQYGHSYTQGTERYLGTLASCLRQHGHHVAFLAGDPLAQERPRGLGERIPQTEELYAYPTRGAMAVRGISQRYLMRWLHTHRPDVVHVANPAHVGVNVVRAARAVNIPVVITTMDFWWVCPKSTLLLPDGSLCDGTPPWQQCVCCYGAGHPRMTIRRLAERGWSRGLLSLFAARQAARQRSPADILRWTRRRDILVGTLQAADGVIFPSRATRDVYEPRLRPECTHLIPYGLGAEWFLAPRQQSRGPKAPEALTIGFAGAMLPHKGPHVLLAAIRHLGWRETVVRLAGDGEDRSYEAALRLAARGLKVEFMGRVPTAGMPGFLRTLDMLVVPSLWPENLPFIVLEGQAAGVPVVASRLAGIADQIRDDRLLFEPGEPAELGFALEYARLNPGAAAASRVWTAEEMTDATERVYDAARARHKER